MSWAKWDDDWPSPSAAEGNAYVTGRSHTLTGLEPGIAYKVSVRAHYSDGAGPARYGPWGTAASAWIIAPPLAPTGLTAAASQRGVMLEWDAPTDSSINGYEVVRARHSSRAQTHFRTGGAATRYLDTDADPETGYTYELRAINRYGVGASSIAVNVTTLARLPGRDDLYGQISPPMAPGHVNWGWGSRRDGLRDVVLEFTIHDDVGNWSDKNGYYLMLVHTTISNVGFYFGLQTAISHPGAPRVKGVVFSRWGTRDLANARAAPVDAWTQSAGYEGDFIGVRRAYDWEAGDYRARIAPDGLEEDGEWFSVWITDLRTDVTTWMGALKFPLVGGTASIRSDFVTTLELYGTPTRPIDGPEWYVTVERPVADGVAAQTVVTDYPYDDSPNAMLNSNVRFDPSQGRAHLRIGGTTEREDRPQRHQLR